MNKSAKKLTGFTVINALRILLGVCLVGSAPVMAATITANVSANITGGIAGNASTGLSFGDVSPGISPGSVTVDISGFRTSVGGVTLGMSNPASPAIFQVTGTPSSTYSITSPVSLSLTDGAGNFMTVDNFTSSPSGTGGLLDAGGSQTLTVGGTLHVGANQSGGTYTGVLGLTIVYY